MIVLENTYAKVASRQYINSVVKEEQIVWVHRLLAICRDVFYSNWVTRKSQENVLMQDVQIYDCGCTERREKEDSSSYRDCKLFLSKDRFEVVRVNCDIASILPFRIDIPSSSEGIRFSAEMTRVESNNKVELGEVLGSPHLSLNQYLGSRKILKVLMIHNNVNGIGQIF